MAKEEKASAQVLTEIMKQYEAHIQGLSPAETLSELEKVVSAYTPYTMALVTSWLLNLYEPGTLTEIPRESLDTAVVLDTLLGIMATILRQEAANG